MWARSWEVSLWWSGGSRLGDRYKLLAESKERDEKYGERTGSGQWRPEGSGVREIVDIWVGVVMNRHKLHVPTVQGGLAGGRSSRSNESPSDPSWQGVDSRHLLLGCTCTSALSRLSIAFAHIHARASLPLASGQARPNQNSKVHPIIPVMTCGVGPSTTASLTCRGGGAALE